MKKPARDPDVADVAPTDPVLTVYDEEHIVTYLRMLDADKEGFPRAERSLIQTIGRAARNSQGKVIMYGDKVTQSMQVALDETNRRRAIQMAYNEKMGIIPQTIKKMVHAVPEATKVVETKKSYGKTLPAEELAAVIANLEQEMRLAAQNLDFERAAEIRDAVIELKGEENKYKMTSQQRGSGTRYDRPKREGRKGSRKTS